MSSSSSVQNAPLQELRQALQKLCAPVRQPPGDIRVIVNEEDVTDIRSIIVVPRGTSYAGCLLEPRLVLPKELPASPLRGFFTTRIFDPNAAVPLGDICVSTLKQDRKLDLCLQQILLTIKYLLTASNPESALNREGDRMLMEKYDDPGRRAQIQRDTGI